MKHTVLFFFALLASQAHAQWGDTLTNNPVYAGPYAQIAPHGVSDGTNGAIIVWIDAPNAYLTGIYAQRLEGTTGNRMFNPAGVQLFSGTLSGGVRFNDAVTDDAGGAIVAWGTVNTPLGFVQAQRISGDGTPLWTQPVSVTSGPRMSSTSRMIADGSGGAIVVWGERDSALVGWVYAQRFNSDGDPQWGSSPMRVCDNTVGNQFNPMIAGDDLGGAIVVWEDIRLLVQVDLYAQRINAAGMRQWSADGVVVASDPTYKLLQGAVSDDAGGAVICWGNTTVDGNSVLVQRLDSLGGQRWNPSGVLLAGPGKFVAPQIVRDGDGGAVVAWGDSSQGFVEADIYAQRIDPSGSPVWGNPVPVCVASGWQFGFSIMALENSGSIISWTDIPDLSNPTESDVYVQKLNGDGEPAWRINGAPVSRASGGQANPVLIPDEAGGSIAVWGDNRNAGNFQDIYAQNLAALGLSETVTNTITQTNTDYPFVAGSAPLLTANFSALGSVSEMTVDAYINAQPPGLTRAVPRYLGISADGTGFSATLTFNYTDQEVEAAGIVNGDANLKLYRNEGAGWVLQGGVVDTALNTLTLTNVTGFSLWAMRDPVDTVATSVHSAPDVPFSFLLNQNYPNPFNPTTTIRFEIPGQDFTSLKVLNILGQEVATLVNEKLDAGKHKKTFDAKSLPSGIYFYRLTSGSLVDVKKFVLIR